MKHKNMGLESAMACPAKECKFPAKIDEVANMCQCIIEAARYHGMNDKCLWKLETSLDEACTNISIYGYKGREDGQIWLTWDFDNDEFKVTIEDEGIPFDQSQPTHPKFDVALCDRKPGGLGRFIMRQFLDDITYERKNGRNRLTLVKKLNDQTCCK